jgi:hypothetical protein
VAVLAAHAGCIVWSACSIWMALPCGIFACIASFGMLGANDPAMYTSTKATAMMCNIASTVIGLIWVIIVVILLITAASVESTYGYDDDRWNN